GKSTTGRAILRLDEPTSGEIEFDGEDLLSLSKRQMRKKRKDLQVIFQDPYGSLNPRQTIRIKRPVWILKNDLQIKSFFKIHTGLLIRDKPFGKSLAKRWKFKIPFQKK